METILLVDHLVLEWIQPLRNSVLDTFFRAATWAGSLYLLLPATLLLLIFLRRKKKNREVLLVSISMAGAVFLVHAAKLLFQRPRPAFHPGVVTLPADWSFPSAHAAQITTFCLCIGLMAMRHLPVSRAWPAVLLGIVLTAVVGVSRIYLQVHYFTDVAGGMVLGGLVVVAADLSIKS